MKNDIQLSFPQSLEIEAAAKEAGGQRRFSMNAYTGQVMNVGFGQKLIVDLAGVTIGAQRKPILRDHDSSKIVGYSEEVALNDKGIQIKGVVMKSSPAGQDVTAAADEGFPWQASVGMSIAKFQFLQANEETTVNGKKLNGPLIVARKTTLNESSFVALGADGNTESIVLSKDCEKNFQKRRTRLAGERGPSMAIENDDSEAGAKGNISKLSDLTISEFKASAPKLYDSIKAEAIREDRERLSGIKAAIVDSALPAAVQGTLGLKCQEMNLEQAQKEIMRVCQIEASLKVAEVQGLSADQIKCLRADVEGLPHLTAANLIKASVDAIKGNEKRLVNEGDTAGKGKNTDNGGETEAQKTLKASVKKAREDFKVAAVSFPNLTEADFVAQRLDGLKLQASEAELAELLK